MPLKDVLIKSPLEIIDSVTVSVRSSPTIVWRGQHSSKWGLTPSLFRLKPESREWQSVEYFLLRDFEMSNAKWVREHYAEGFIERLTLAQHHRLPTRLLDLT
jgi:hypothetical protein